jgi:transposase
VVLRKRIARSESRLVSTKLPPLCIGVEACGSAHDWARCLRGHGDDVRLIAPPFVKAYVKSPKNDARAAEAVWEGVSRPPMREVTCGIIHVVALSRFDKSSRREVE